MVVSAPMRYFGNRISCSWTEIYERSSSSETISASSSPEIDFAGVSNQFSPFRNKTLIFSKLIQPASFLPKKFK